MCSIIRTNNLAALETFWDNKKTNLSYVHLYYSFLPWHNSSEADTHPICLALNCNRQEEATFLLEHGIPPSNRVLGNALANGKWEFVKKLLNEYHMSLNTSVYMIFFLNDGRPELVSIGASEFTKIAPFFSDCKEFLNIELYPNRYLGYEAEFIKTVQILLDLGMDANQLFDFEEEKIGSFTPLMAAATAGYIDVVKLLLAHGADPNITFQGKTARELCIDLQLTTDASRKLFHINHAAKPPNLEGIIKILTEAEKNEAL